jgi:hypothetical protein
VRPVDSDWQLDLLAREARERTDDRARSSGAVERATRPPRNDSGPQPAEHERGFAPRCTDLVCDALEHVLERGVEHPGRRRDVGTEEAHVEAAETAERPETLALLAGGVDRSCPIGAHTELARAQAPAPAPDFEVDGRVLEGLPLPLQERLRRAGLEAADVDPCDPHAVGERRRGPGEREPEHDSGQREEDGDDRRPAQEDEPP